MIGSLPNLSNHAVPTFNYVWDTAPGGGDHLISARGGFAAGAGCVDTSMRAAGPWRQGAMAHSRETRAISDAR
ncbi:MAG: hypothetical protein GAK40_00251 [Burkholderia plantarii]|nr:MAG: hypothetical protein GAK40_00251 [Burkholderia plantarii]